jgi:hypothetical protein
MAPRLASQQGKDQSSKSTTTWDAYPAVGASVVHARFRVVEYRWAFGDGQGLVTTGPGTRGLDSEVRTAFRRRGHYRVGVTVVWAAEAFLDGRRVGQVDDLVSAAQTTYPVAEIRTILTG